MKEGNFLGCCFLLHFRSRLTGQKEALTTELFLLFLLYKRELQHRGVLYLPRVQGNRAAKPRSLNQQSPSAFSSTCDFDVLCKT